LVAESIKAFSETDFTDDLKKFDIPTLVMHGEDDQIVPVKDSAKKSAKLIKGAKEIYYPGAPHGLTATVRPSRAISRRAKNGAKGGRNDSHSAAVGSECSRKKCSISLAASGPRGSV
jgi:hypothetical protein